MLLFREEVKGKSQGLQSIGLVSVDLRLIRFHWKFTRCEYRPRKDTFDSGRPVPARV